MAIATLDDIQPGEFLFCAASDMLGNMTWATRVTILSDLILSMNDMFKKPSYKFMAYESSIFDGDDNPLMRLLTTGNAGQVEIFTWDMGIIPPGESRNNAHYCFTTQEEAIQAYTRLKNKEFNVLEQHLFSRFKRIVDESQDWVDFE